MKTLALIDRRIDELKLNKNFSKYKHHLELTEKEFKTLKKSVIPIDLYDKCEIIKYRGIFIKVKR